MGFSLLFYRLDLNVELRSVKLSIAANKVLLAQQD
jgi:hypothetical protein